MIISFVCSQGFGPDECYHICVRVGVANFTSNQAKMILSARNLFI